jgi:predicted nucleic-acid-binding protein
VIGLDTNVLVRYIAQDDPIQAAVASRLIENFTAEQPGFISTVTMVETVWVLMRAYKVPKQAIIAIIEGLLRARDLVVDAAETHYVALGIFQASTIDYADAVIAQSGKRAGCGETVTFDRRAADGLMRLIGEAEFSN